MATPVSQRHQAARKLYCGPLLERVATRECRTTQSGTVA